MRFVREDTEGEGRVIHVEALRLRLNDPRQAGALAQRLGLGLAEIEQALATLPQGRTPTLSDWQRISRSLRCELDARINLLTRTRAKLDECIGCGCLSLDRCRLYNKDDRAGAAGAGPRFVLD